MKKKLIIINGTMGVGKTTVSKKLYKEFENSFWIDGDNCWMMNPFVVNDENKDMVLRNIGFMINSFLNNSSTRYIVFNWVIQSDEIMKSILDKLELEKAILYKITLMCSQEELVRRLKADIASGLRDEKSIERSLERYHMYEEMDTIKVDTTLNSLDEIVEEIKRIVM